MTNDSDIAVLLSEMQRVKEDIRELSDVIDRLKLLEDRQKTAFDTLFNPTTGLVAIQAGLTAQINQWSGGLKVVLMLGGITAAIATFVATLLSGTIHLGGF